MFYPAPMFCTDNGAMIAYAGAQRLQAGQVDDEDTRVRPRWPMEELPPLAARGQLNGYRLYQGACAPTP